MPDPISTLLTQNVAALLMAGGFIWYLNQKDKRNKETFDGFNQLVANHLKENGRAMERQTKSNVAVAKNLQKVYDSLSGLNKTIKGKRK